MCKARINNQKRACVHHHTARQTLSHLSQPHSEATTSHMIGMGPLIPPPYFIRTSEKRCSPSTHPPFLHLHPLPHLPSRLSSPTHLSTYPPTPPVFPSSIPLCHPLPTEILRHTHPPPHPPTPLPPITLPQTPHLPPFHPRRVPSDSFSRLRPAPRGVLSSSPTGLAFARWRFARNDSVGRDGRKRQAGPRTSVLRPAGAAYEAALAGGTVTRVTRRAAMQTRRWGVESKKLGE